MVPPGETIKLPSLANTLKKMVEAERAAKSKGRAAGIAAARDRFYKGDIADDMVAFLTKHEAPFDKSDFAEFFAKVEKPAMTTYRGYEVYKQSFGSQGPVLLEALNILEQFDLQSMKRNSGPYLHTVVEALKLAYADRDTYYGDPKFSKIPADTLLGKPYAEQRRKLIGEQASLEFRPGKIGDNPPVHPFYSDIARYKIPDALMNKDTTCVDAIDKDGVLFSATPSGAWMPSYLAGDTGIPLTQRAESFLLVPGHPNELAGGKRPRVTLSPTLVTNPDGTMIALSTPGGDNQDQSLLQVLMYAAFFGMNAERAVEAPRFQSEHLVSSFDNHAMSPGKLLLDERLDPAVIMELQHRHHIIEMRTRYGSGAAPVIIRITPAGLIEAGADPFYYRAAQAW
jgi:gamma-glutamyltranspeptidase/glutathione hydrolase